MKIIVVSMFLIITILSIIVFKVKGLLLLIITIPLLLLYFKSEKIVKIKDYLLERKEVETVSTRNRKGGLFKKLHIEKKEKVKHNKKSKKDRSRDNRKEHKNGKKKKSFLAKVLVAILSLAIIGVFLIAAFMVYIVMTTGNFDPTALKNQQQTVIYDKDGDVIATLGSEKREEITYDDLPQVLIDAIVATEDSRYYQHDGVDLARFLKATAYQLIGRDEAGGASTLTMQTVKNNLTKKDSEERDRFKKIVRKFQDVYLSVFFMEKKYTKEEILEMYVNDSCLGGIIYGVEEASKYYFGKHASELSLPEAALLAGMYQAPNRYDPYKHPEAAESRRKTVLSLMVRHGYITKEEEKMANAVSIESMLAGGKAAVKYQGYIDTVIEEVEAKTGNNPAQVSMKIYTAMDKTIQDGINRVFSGEEHKWENDVVQAGVVVVNVEDGTIVAVGAGRNRTAGDWNYATQAYRQPGSTAKPIFDYGPGFEYNNFSTYTLFNDEPWGYTNGPEIGNWDGDFLGLITLRTALSISRNIPALKAFQQIDRKNIAKFVNGLGLDVAYSTSSDNYKVYDNGGDNYLNEAYAIGGMSRGVTVQDMAEAYSCYANGGYHIESHTVTKIEYRSTGKVEEFTEKKEKVMSESTAYLMNNVLQYAVEYGFNGGSRKYGTAVAAKTGTSNLDDATIRKYGLGSGAVNDLWTVAYTPEYTMALWYGYKNVDSSHYLTGASAPKDNLMVSLFKYMPATTKKWNPPSSVVAVTVEKDTWPAQLPSEYTPADMKLTEYFKKGTQPTEVSPRYAKFNDVTNLKSSNTTEGYELTWSWTKPDVLDETYLKKYFSNPVYGRQSNGFYEARVNYNINILGGNGFTIYEKKSDGSLEKVAFTTENKYTFKPSKEGTYELVIKAEYKNYAANASDGKSIKIVSDGDYSETSALSVSLKGEKEIELAENEDYKEDGIKAKFDGSDVSSSVTLTFIYDNNSYVTTSALESAINALDKGTYEIEYKIVYKGIEKKLKRKIIKK